jgi:ketosteroid isomerase-like protein
MESANLKTLKNLFSKIESELTSDEFQQTVIEAINEDVVFVQPPSLPHGGVHNGLAGWKTMHSRLSENWKMKATIERYWDLPDEDLVFMYVQMEWMAHSTGKVAKMPALEQVRFRDGKISAAEIFVQDTKAVLDTLEAD